MASQGLIEALKQVSVDAVKAGNPTSVTYGTVESIEPLSVKIDNKLTLDEDFLVLTKNVQKYEVETVVESEISGDITIDGKSATLNHIKFKTKTVVDNSLKVGDKVNMIQAQGGQQYVIIDKLEPGLVEG